MTEFADPAGSMDADRLIKPAEVRDLCGGVSEMTVWRWLNDPASDFPRPVYISRRRYWREADVRAWLKAQATK